MYNSSMPTVPQILAMRQRRRGRPAAPPGVFGLGCAGLLSLGTAFIALFLTVFYANLTRDLPPPESLPALLQPPDGLLQEPTRLYDRTGEHVIEVVENPAAGGRNYLPWDSTTSEHLPAELALTTLVISEPDFWTSPGFTLAGLRQGSHPTLAQRLVANLLLWDEAPGLRRALRERLLAAQVTRLYGRERVLEWYLNSAYYGHLAYGAEAAARVYLGKSAADLSLGEAALLAPIAEAPSLNPIDTPDVAQERQRDLLRTLLKKDLITTQEYREALEEKPVIRTLPPPAPNPMAPFTQIVRQQLAERFGRELVELGGLEVITTLDYNLQLQVDCAIASHLSQAEGKNENSLAADGAPCQSARLLPTQTAINRQPLPDLAAAVIVMDPTTGEVLALAGDPAQGIDVTLQPARPPGTLLTPFIHLIAYTRGLSPGSLTWDIPSSVPATLADSVLLDGPFQGPVRLRMALANDYLGPTLLLLSQMGPDTVWNTAQQLGLRSLEIPRGEAAFLLPLQGGNLPLTEIALAYGVFSNQGVLAGRPEDTNRGDDGPLRPGYIQKVSDRAGKVLLDVPQVRTKPVISAQLAYLITQVLSDETARWASLGHPNPLEIGRPVAAKIGVTQDGSDAWTVGYTPQLVIGVWNGLGAISAGQSVPASLAAGLWHAVTQYATRDLPPENWPVPSGISIVDVCDPSGMLPTTECPSVVSEVFLHGNEPAHGDTLYRKVQINRETGRLATVFTPPELIDERVYLSVPPEAETWALQAGLPTPPDSYDLIYLPTSSSRDVEISIPDLFAYAQGEIEIHGRATGPGFTFYRLQYGKGLNPQAWTQLGADTHTAVEEGVLGIWDTSGLKGLYALRLLVVREDQRVDTATIQITVDNQPPEVLILSPADGESILNSEGRPVTIQARASDDIAVDRVEIYLDRRLITTLRTPPYAFPWRSNPGDHTLLIKAVDLAGNSTQQAISFSIAR